MGDADPAAAIPLLLFLILGNALFSGFVAALEKINPRGEEGEEPEGAGSQRNRLLCALAEDAKEFSGTLHTSSLLLNLVLGGLCLQRIALLAGKLGQKLLLSFLDPAPGWAMAAVWVAAVFLAILAVAFVLLVFGFQLPRIWAEMHAQRFVNLALPLVRGIRALLLPLTRLSRAAAGAVMRLLRIQSPGGRSDVTEDEIISMVEESHEQGFIEASEAQMIHNIFEFGDKQAQDIMTNRRDIDAIDAQMPFGEAVSSMLDGSHSRYPVYEGNIDNIIGILHLKDALRRRGQTPESMELSRIPGLLRQVKFIPGTRKVDVLFRSMQSTKQQMVIVVDEYGQTLGLIAMEDILEEIVGNLLDEYDDEEVWILEKGQGVYVIEGKTRLEDLEERFGISFPEQEFETINGYMISRLEHIPEKGEKFDVTVDGYRFGIMEVENKMISKVLVTKLLK